jgi:spermidine synthase
MWGNMFPEMSELVPEGAKGCARVEHITVNAEGGRTASYVYGEFKNPSPAGTYARLRVTDDAGKTPIMMSDFLYERVTCEEVVRRAHGDVLIAGLGLGMILHPILQKHEVRSVTVVEKYQDVVDLISPTLPDNPRLTVITDDIFRWQPPDGRHYDVIWFDIWPDIEARRLREMRELHRRYRTYLNHSNPECWMESWHRRETLEGMRREKAAAIQLRLTAMNESKTLEC